MSQPTIEPPLTGSETLRFRAGDVLFREGEQPAGVYILQSGEVDLLFASRSGSVKPLRHAMPGQILGLSSVVTQRPHDCTATARSGCEAGFIERMELLQLLDESPSVWFSVLRLLSSDVNAAYNDMRHLVTR